MTIKAEILVIGSGPGGYVAAIRAAQLGKKVTIVEANEIGGVCLNVGCIPSKALITAGHRYQESLEADFFGINVENVHLDFKKTQEWKENAVVHKLTSGIEMLLKKNQVNIIKGTAVFTSNNSVEIKSNQGTEMLSFEQAIIATGSRPIEIKNFPFKGRILDSTGGLNLKELPKRLMIIGGGYIGCELAGAYANLGAQVTLIEGSDSILPNFEPDIQTLVLDGFKKKGVRVITKAQALNAEEKSHEVTVDIAVNRTHEKLTADYVMVTVGRKPNTDRLDLLKAGIETEKNGRIKVNDQYQTTCNQIFAIGDIVSGPALAHKASYEGKVAAEVAAGKNVKKDYRVVPAICFTDPEVATVGLTLSEAKTQEIKAKTAQFPMQANGRALSLNAVEGFVRIVFEEETNLVLGAQIVGTNASDLIAEITLAIESFLTLEDIALTIHGHPTLSEMVMDASEVGLGLPIHM